jgi:hypothetical protein
MGHYFRGDVVMVHVAFEERGGAKTRPAVVIATGQAQEIYLCAVSSKRPSDAPYVPISLDDFSEGGLALFGESYVLTSRIFVIRNGEVIGKRGRLVADVMTSIALNVSPSDIPGNHGTKGMERS